MIKQKQTIFFLFILMNCLLNAQLIHQNDFNTESNWDSAYNFNRRTNFTHHTNGGYNNSGYIQVKVSKGEHYGGEMKFIFANNNLQDPQEIYAQYKVYYESTMDSYSGKSPGFDGTRGVAGWGNKSSDGTNGWSARGSISPSGATKTRNRYYVYHKDMSRANGKTWGDSWYWSGGNSTMQHNTWYTVEQYIKVNDVSSSNGVLKAWIDGVKVFEKINIRFTTTSNNNFDKVYAYWFNYYHGGSAVSPKDAYIRIDDFKLSTNAILSVANNGINTVTIFPNPAKNYISIEGAKDLNSIEIIDLNGKIVISKKGDFKKIDISALSKGVYFLKLRKENSIKLQKLIKN
ncbi:putative secreted protein (Por secretion system target) [Lutibacter sp. Hel_I_33_5]|uniref:T9SS type A sorting domain-containing protein n=1 Tax=Lutibacter sp. Hel_I_33_5 TaxID=1566289 RepID=UPI0011A2DCF2|nr:T9SS type A sorting domain-containing protein [Lutibacter sp. Hel_I_33_5]TVZ55025.1 putative secreted protein (Por secretion system target) [Lutibacter sp. Hel_I_33_5]